MNGKIKSQVRIIKHEFGPARACFDAWQDRMPDITSYSYKYLYSIHSQPIRRKSGYYIFIEWHDGFIRILRLSDLLPAY